MPSAASWMQLEIITLRQKWKDKYIITYMWTLKHGTNEPVYKTETDSQAERSDLCLSRERRKGRELVWEFGDKHQGPTVHHRELYPVSWDNP